MESSPGARFITKVDIAEPVGGVDVRMAKPMLLTSGVRIKLYVVCDFYTHGKRRRSKEED